MGIMNELKIPRWKQGYPRKNYLPFTLADTGGIWCVNCLKYLCLAGYNRGDEGVFAWNVNKHHPIQSSWAKKICLLRYLERIASALNQCQISMEFRFAVNVTQSQRTHRRRR